MTLDTLLANAPANLARWHEVHAYLTRRLPKEEGRYDLGDEWIEYLIVNDEHPEVILDQSNEDIDLWDVYEDLCRPAPAAMPDRKSSPVSTELDELKIGWPIWSRS